MRPEAGFIAVATEYTVGGMLVRRVWPFILGVPVAFGWLRVWRDQGGFWETTLGVTLAMATIMVILSAVIWWTAQTLGRIHRERHRAEQALRQSEAIYRALLQGIPDMVMRFDRQGRHQFVSTNIQTFMDIPTREFIGRTHRELGFTASVCLFWEKVIHKVFEDGAPLETEFSFPGIQGETIFNLRLVPEFTLSGELHWVLAISRDVTEQRRVERNYQTLFREMLKGFAVHEMICTPPDTPVDYRFLEINPAFEILTGLKAEDIVGRTALEVLPGLEPFWIQTFGRVALTGEPAFFENYSRELSKYYEVRAFRPATHQFACTLTDITDRKRAEAEKKRLEIQLLHAQKMEAIGILAGGVAHDFNNLLQAINGYTQLLIMEKSQNDPDGPKLRAILEAGNRAAELVRQLLLFSRKVETEHKLVELNQEMRQAVKILQRTIPKMVKIDIHLDNGLWPIKADPVQLEQIILNLATNAGDAMPDGGTLRIETANVTLSEEYAQVCLGAKPGRYVLLTVSDTGHGMDPETVKHIYEPFFTTKEGGKGTGLGLASV